MSTGEDVFKAVEVAGNLTPAVVSLVTSLIQLGKSPAEAEEIVRRDIESRRAQYEREKAEDEAALLKKHGRTEP